MSVTSAPIGATGQSLDGFAVDANVPDAFRESVVITGPNVSTEVIVPTSTQPVSVYALPTWILGQTSTFVTNQSTFVRGTSQVFGQVSTFPTGVTSTHSVNNVSTYPNVSSFVTNQLTTTSVNVLGTASTQIVSSIPILVAQSTSPWVVSTAPIAITGTTMVNITSSIPLLVTQSATSNPWVINGGINVSSQSAVSSSFPIGTTSTQVVSSVPYWVSQSSAPWVVVENASTASNLRSTSMSLIATLNTTVVKAGPGAVYGVQYSNFSSTSVFVKLANASSAVIASTAQYIYRVGLAPSTSVFAGLDIGINFSTGITMFTTRNQWDSDLTAPLGSTCVVNILYA